MFLLQLEKLQAENAAEWARRELLESEKLALERENKNLNAEIDNLTEEVERKSRQASAAVDTDLRSLNNDLAERSKVRMDKISGAITGINHEAI